MRTRTNKEELSFDLWWKRQTPQHQKRMMVVWIYMIINDYLLCPCWVKKAKVEYNARNLQSYEVSSPGTVIKQDYYMLDWNYTE